MSMQQIMTWGHDFPKDKGGKYLTLGSHWGKAKCQWENPSNSQLPFLSHTPNHLILPKMVEVVIAWGWEEHGHGF